MARRTIDPDMLKGFRDFLMRGNVVDLAVAVVIGAAFGAVVAAFADDFIGGILGAIGGSPDFGDAGFTVNGSKIVYGLHADRADPVPDRRGRDLLRRRRPHAGHGAGGAASRRSRRRRRTRSCS